MSDTMQLDGITLHRVFESPVEKWEFWINHEGLNHRCRAVLYREEPPSERCWNLWVYETHGYDPDEPHGSAPYLDQIIQMAREYFEPSDDEEFEDPSDWDPSLNDDCRSEFFDEECEPDDNYKEDGSDYGINWP